MSSSRPRFRYRARRAGDHARFARRRIWPWVTAGVFALVLVVGIVGAVFAREALSVRDDLMAAKSKVGQITSLVSAGDTEGVQRVAQETLELTARADKTVAGPLWDFAAGVPFVGQNIAAVKSATQATHILVRDAVPVGVRLLETIDPSKLKLEGGGINLDPFEQAQSDLPAITAAFGAAKAKIEPIELDALHPVVSDALRELIEVVDQAAPALEMLEKYLPTLLQMLGKDEPREYMVIFQNNAEIRATGGNPATFNVMQVEAGDVEKRDDWVSAQAFNMGISGVQYADMPQETLDLYEWDFARFSQNYSRTPDFPTTAHLFNSLWQNASGEPLDGVISIDPPALARMLTVTGPVTLADGSEINADNAVSMLLFETYERFGLDGASADAYFADVADRVFEKVTSGDWDPMAMLKALQWGVEEQRIYAWFPREEEQAVSLELGIDGALSSDNEAETQVGVYVNDAAYSKLEYFYSQDVAVTCDTAARTMTTTLTMRNTITDPNLNGYTLGWRNNSLGLPRTTMILDVMYFAPPGSTITGFEPAAGDFDGWDRAGAEKGHPVQSVSVALPMGETRTVSFTSTLPEGELGPLAVRHAPTVGETPVTIDASCGGL
ncbi:DUF4012 domain-containing protein [Microbacterium sediminis]|uniref:Uncharacterized protein n=1 Tax=Microbacterium sediminis TaxID=904291 RepID=A0A1B9NDL5_9MICO|nr:DUF4012 domain-containing protein [Microbacterium sediminis]OCG74678.1 hypothetical protein A7J15_03865 [Microbacterium sediminis]QBR74975.1 DUF4012 domain-containing protein [Microbacterium sediminis]